MYDDPTRALRWLDGICGGRPSALAHALSPGLVISEARVAFRRGLRQQLVDVRDRALSAAAAASGDAA